MYFSISSLRSAEGSTSIIKIFVEFLCSGSNNIAPVSTSKSTNSNRVKTRWNDWQSMRKAHEDGNKTRADDCRAKCIVFIVPSPWISNGVSSRISFRIKHSSIHRIETINIRRATAWKIFLEKVHWNGMDESSINRCVVDDVIFKLFDNDTQEEKCLMNNSNCC